MAVSERKTSTGTAQLPDLQSQQVGTRFIHGGVSSRDVAYVEAITREQLPLHSLLVQKATLENRRNSIRRQLEQQTERGARLVDSAESIATARLFDQLTTVDRNLGTAVKSHDRRKIAKYEKQKERLNGKIGAAQERVRVMRAHQEQMALEAVSRNEQRSSTHLNVFDTEFGRTIQQAVGAFVKGEAAGNSEQLESVIRSALGTNEVQQILTQYHVKPEQLLQQVVADAKDLHEKTRARDDARTIDHLQGVAEIDRALDEYKLVLLYSGDQLYDSNGNSRKGKILQLLSGLGNVAYTAGGIALTYARLGAATASTLATGVLVGAHFIAVPAVALGLATGVATFSLPLVALLAAGYGVYKAVEAVRSAKDRLAQADRALDEGDAANFAEKTKGKAYRKNLFRQAWNFKQGTGTQKALRLAGALTAPLTATEEVRKVTAVDIVAKRASANALVGGEKNAAYKGRNSHDTNGFVWTSGKLGRPTLKVSETPRLSIEEVINQLQHTPQDAVAVNQAMVYYAELTGRLANGRELIRGTQEGREAVKGAAERLQQALQLIDPTFENRPEYQAIFSAMRTRLRKDLDSLHGKNKSTIWQAAYDGVLAAVGAFTIMKLIPGVADALLHHSTSVGNFLGHLEQSVEADLGSSSAGRVVQMGKGQVDALLQQTGLEQTHPINFVGFVGTAHTPEVHLAQNPIEIPGHPGMQATNLPDGWHFNDNGTQILDGNKGNIVVADVTFPGDGSKMHLDFHGVYGNGKPATIDVQPGTTLKADEYIGQNGVSGSGNKIIWANNQQADGHGDASWGIHDQVVTINGRQGVSANVYDLVRYPGPAGWKHADFAQTHLGIYSEKSNSVLVFQEQRVVGIPGNTTIYHLMKYDDAKGQWVVSREISSDEVSRLMTDQDKIDNFASNGGQSSDFSGETQHDYVNHWVNVGTDDKDHGQVTIYAMNQAKGNTTDFNTLETSKTVDFSQYSGGIAPTPSGSFEGFTNVHQASSGVYEATYAVQGPNGPVTGTIDFPPNAVVTQTEGLNGMVHIQIWQNGSSHEYDLQIIHHGLDKNPEILLYGADGKPLPVGQNEIVSIKVGSDGTISIIDNRFQHLDTAPVTNSDATLNVNDAEHLKFTIPGVGKVHVVQDAGNTHEYYVINNATGNKEYTIFAQNNPSAVDQLFVIHQGGGTGEVVGLIHIQNGVASLESHAPNADSALFTIGNIQAKNGTFSFSFEALPHQIFSLNGHGVNLDNGMFAVKNDHNQWVIYSTTGKLHEVAHNVTLSSDNKLNYVLPNGKSGEAITLHPDIKSSEFKVEQNLGKANTIEVVGGGASVFFGSLVLGRVFPGIKDAEPRKAIRNGGIATAVTGIVGAVIFGNPVIGIPVGLGAAVLSFKGVRKVVYPWEGRGNGLEKGLRTLFSSAAGFGGALGASVALATTPVGWAGGLVIGAIIGAEMMNGLARVVGTVISNILPHGISIPHPSFSVPRPRMVARAAAGFVSGARSGAGGNRAWRKTGGAGGRRRTRTRSGGTP